MTEESKKVETPESKDASKLKPKKSNLWLFCCLGAFIFVVIIVLITTLIYLKVILGSSGSNRNPKPTPTSQNTTRTRTDSQETAPLDSRNCVQTEIALPETLNITPDNPGLKKASENIYYNIYGTTALDLKNQMDACGPKSDQAYYAYTWWNINWKYNYVRGITSCGIKDVAVGVKIDYWYPKWQEPEKYEKGLKERWEKYYSKVVEHEETHGQNGLDAGKEVLETLSNLPKETTCDAMFNKVNSSADEITARYNAKDKEFDDTTNHGQTQGTVFP